MMACAERFMASMRLKTLCATNRAPSAASRARKISETASAVTNEDGSLRYYQGFVVDITAQKKARHAAFYGSPSKDGADAVKKGNVEVLAFPEFFPNQGGLPIRVDGHVLGGISASGAKSEIDEAIAQAGLDALLKK